MSLRLLNASIVALALACGGCFGGRSAASALDTEISERDSVVPGAAVETQLEQTGNVVTFTAKGTCDLHRIVTVDQVVIHSRDQGSSSSSSGNLGLVAGIMLGVGGIVGGGLVIGKATTTPTINPGAKVVGGAILASLGVAVTGVMIWTLTPGGQRWPSTYSSVERSERDDGVVTSNVPCEDVRSVPVLLPVTGRLPGGKPVEIALGATDKQGKLTFDVAQKVPPELLVDPATPRTMPVYVKGFNAGIVRLDGGASAREERGWDGAAAVGCAAAATSSLEACAPLQVYLRNFPTGLHAAEAKVALERAEVLQKAKDDVAAREAKRRAEATAKAGAAAEAARRGAQAACRKICATSCKGDVDCTNACASTSCP